jgi:multidrug resistance efflux pump
MDASVETARMTDQPLIYEAVGTVKAGITSNLASKLLGTQEKLALATYKRYRDLKKQYLISAQNFEDREAHYRQANAALLLSRAAVPILYYMDKRWEFAHHHDLV